MVAVRERELAASVMGVDVRRVKVAAFTAAAFMAGASGALYASYLSFAQPGEWSLLLSIQFVAAVIVGGMGSLAGPLLGSAVVFAFRRCSRTCRSCPRRRRRRLGATSRRSPTAS